MPRKIVRAEKEKKNIKYKMKKKKNLAYLNHRLAVRRSINIDVNIDPYFQEILHEYWQSARMWNTPRR